MRCGAGAPEAPLGVVRFAVRRAKSEMIDRKLKPPVVSKSLTRSDQHASPPAAYRLYLPEDWAADRKRRRKTGVPKLDFVHSTPHTQGRPRRGSICDAEFLYCLGVAET